MWLKSIDGNERTFLFESSNPEHEEFMQQVKTGFRGRPYTVGAAAVELPDVVANYALANVEGIEETASTAPDEAEEYLCTIEDCERSQPGHGYTTPSILKGHMTRTHGQSEE